MKNYCPYFAKETGQYFTGIHEDMTVETKDCQGFYVAQLWKVDEQTKGANMKTGGKLGESL